MINLFQPNVGNEAISILEEVFSKNWLGRGEYSDRFETSLSDILKVERDKITTMSCCTDAIFAILAVLRQRGLSGNVIVPSNSFPAVGSSVVANGFELVLCDIEKKTGNIDLNKLSQIFNEETIGVFVTHYGGIPVNIPALRAVVGETCLIMEDAACALGSFYSDGSAVGTLSDFGCWSFDAMKLIVAGEGGAAYLRDSEMMREFREQLYLGLPISSKSGIDKAAKTDEVWWSYELNRPGTRSVFSNINAAIGLSQLPKLDGYLKRRSEIREQYLKAFNGHKNISVVEQDNALAHSNYFFTILAGSRDELAIYMRDQGIYTSLRYHSLDQISLFKSAKRTDMSGSKYFADQALNLPIHNSLSDEDVGKIINIATNFGR